jgi:hypothetical protein
MGLRGKLRRLEDRAQAIAAETKTDEKLEHEHGLETFVEKTSSLPFMDRRVTGLDLGGVVHDA